MSEACSVEGCTVNDTGKCALERDPATCPNRVLPASPTVPGGEGVEATEDIGAPVLTMPDKAPSLPPSTVLDYEDVKTLMSSRYVTIVGILGEPESGKTACLVSLYLLVSNGRLERWAFADSRSLMGFEEISRGAREWNEGHPPEHLTIRTELADDRRPGFLHLRLKRKVDGRRVDFALPDLPGEWTRSLIVSSQTDRLDFLRSADTVWLVADGRALRDREQRGGAINRLGQLGGRVRAMFQGAPPQLLVVVTHRDKGVLAKDVCDR